MTPLQTTPKVNDFVFVGLLTRCWLLVVGEGHDYFIGIDLESAKTRTFKYTETGWAEENPHPDEKGFRSPLYKLSTEEGRAFVEARRAELFKAGKEAVAQDIHYRARVAVHVDLLP